MKGYTFNRQRPVLSYIAEFMCKPLMLIIEVDGITHFTKEARKQDDTRQNNLQKAGFLVIRFTDEQVLTSISLIRDIIEQHVSAQEQSLMPNQHKEKTDASPLSPPKEHTRLHQVLQPKMFTSAQQCHAACLPLLRRLEGG